MEPRAQAWWSGDWYQWSLVLKCGGVEASGSVVSYPGMMERRPVAVELK